MKMEAAIEILQKYQTWRHGDVETYPFSPEAVGIALDAVINNSLPLLTERNYAATMRRGRITEETSFIDLIQDLKGEVQELLESVIYSQNYDVKPDASELADIVFVCGTIAKRHDIDLVQALLDKVAFNEKRED